MVLDNVSFILKPNKKTAPIQAVLVNIRCVVLALLSCTLRPIIRRKNLYLIFIFIAFFLDLRHYYYRHSYQNR